MADTDIPLRKIDHVRFFVGNARQSAFFYRNAFGFDIVAYAGLETGLKHEVDWLCRQGNTRFLFSASLRPVTSAMISDILFCDPRSMPFVALTIGMPAGMWSLASV